MLHHERSNQRELHLNVNGGIGNRFVSLFTAIRLLDQQYYDYLYVYWLIDNSCMVHLSDLFHIKSNRIIEMRANLEGANFVKARKTQKHVPNESGLLILDQADQIYLNTTSPLGKERDEANEQWLSEMRQCLYKYLEIKQEFVMQVSLYNIDKATIGIHCRRSDSGLVEIAAKYPQDIKEISAKYKLSVDLYVLEYMTKNGIRNQCKYLSSEDINTKAFMMHHTENTILQETKAEVKMLYDIKSNWQDDQYETTHYWWMTVRSKASIHEAFVDWINLARCGTIYTDYPSNFAISAAYYTSVNVIDIGRPILDHK
jgi:hypothetical protein